MAITVECTNQDCRQLFSVSEKETGEACECPVCKTEIVVKSTGSGGHSATGAVEKLGGYEIVRLLGEGGMGMVYEAIQEGLQRRVALKVLTERLTKDTTFLDRFKREAQAAAALNHPNIVQVFEIGEHEGTHFFSMEYAEGEDRHEKLRRGGRVSSHEALDIVKQTAAALKYAHEEHHIIHRDVKPDNIILTANGKVKLVDLGLARKTDTNTRFTQTNAGMGTPHYMAPEQTQNAHYVDHRADIYSLGITLFFLLTGRRPFDGDSAFSIAVAHHSQPLPSPIDFGIDLSEEIYAVLTKMCAKLPDERYEEYGPLIDDLDRAFAGESTVATKELPSLTASVMPYEAKRSTEEKELVFSETVWPEQLPTSETHQTEEPQEVAAGQLSDRTSASSATTIAQRAVTAALQSRWGVLAVGLAAGCLIYGLSSSFRISPQTPEPEVQDKDQSLTQATTSISRQEPLAGIAQILKSQPSPPPEPEPDTPTASNRLVPSFGSPFQQSSADDLSKRYEGTLKFIKENPDKCKSVLARLTDLSRRSLGTLHETPVQSLLQEYESKMEKAAEEEFTKRTAESAKLEKQDQKAGISELWSKFPAELLSEKIETRIQKLLKEKGLPKLIFRDERPTPSP